MYNSLLLSTGGGIISNKQRSEQDPAPVVIIGCGGTGAMGLHVLKDKVYRQLEPDNPGDPVPKYGHIRFVAIDSDVEWVSKTSLNNDGEFCNLQDEKIRGKFENPVTLANMLKEERYQWLSAGQKSAANIKIPTDLNGAGGIRQLGRYLVINEAQRLYNSIKAAIDNAVKGPGQDSNKLVVHILAGISGGMGSGSFIDVCYITRKVLRDKGITGASIFGYFFLPDVITTKNEVKDDPTKIQSNYKNGYAALLELDYLMQLKENHGHFVQNYGSFQVDTDVPPVDMCHLISAIDANGNERPDGFEYCINVVADYIMSYLSRIKTAAGDLSPKGSLANVNEGVDMLAVGHGAYHRYHVLGASNAEMPMTQVATYLATGLYQRMSENLLREPVDADVEKFCKDQMKYTLPELKRQISEKVKMGCQVPEPQMELVKGISQSHVHSTYILQPMDDWLFEQQGQLEKNYQGLNMDVEPGKYQQDANATSLIGLLFNHLIDYALDPAYGPSYAAMLLERNGKTISAFLQGLHTEIDNAVKDAQRQENFQAEQTEQAKQAFCASKNTLFNKKVESEAYEAYRGALGIWYRRKLDTVTYQQMDKLVMGLKEKVDAMNTIYFKRLKHMLDELKVTFEANAHYFEDPRNTNAEVADDGYTMRIMKFSELQSHLDAVLSAENPMHASSAFTQYLIDQSAKWLSDDEYQIRQMVNDFIGNRFKTEMNRTLEGYLQEKFPGMSPMEIQQQLPELIFRPLFNRSEPLFWCSPSVSVSDTYTSVSLSVPNTANDVVQAAEDYGKAVAHYTLRPCEIGDRIFMIRLYSGMPLYGYHGMDLIQKAYDEKIASAGIHLYERGRVNWKDALVSLVPFSIDKKKTKNYSSIETALKEAEQIGILKFDASKDAPEDVTACFVRKSGLEENKELQKLLTDLNAIGTPDQTSEWTNESKAAVKQKHFELKGQYAEYLVDEAIASLNGYLRQIESGEDAEELSVECDGTSNKKEVCIDHLVQSYVLRQTMQQEVELYHAIELAKARLEEIKAHGHTETALFDDFFHALVLGFLKQGIGKVSFTYEVRHREEEMVLASSSMPYGKNFLLYQAYLSYRDMDEDIRADLKEQTDHKVDNLEEGDDAIARKLLDKYNAKVMKELETKYRTESAKDEIEKFYTDLVDNLYSFTEKFE
jgi:hypothetical protein